MGHRGAATGAGVEPGCWGRASPTSQIPVSLSPPVSFCWVAMASCRVWGPVVMLRTDCYGGASWVRDTRGSLQPLTQPCYIKCSHALWVFSSLLLALALIFGLFSLSCF